MNKRLTVRVLVLLVLTLAGIVHAQTNVNVDCSGSNPLETAPQTLGVLTPLSLHSSVPQESVP